MRLIVFGAAGRRLVNMRGAPNLDPGTLTS